MNIKTLSMLTLCAVIAYGCSDSSSSKTDGCELGQKQCADGMPQVCNDGQWVNAEACGTGLACQDGECKEDVPAGKCADGKKQCTNGVPQHCANGAWANDAPCNQGFVCKDGECKEDALGKDCEGAQKRCDENLNPQHCANGAWANDDPCKQGFVCKGGDCEEVQTGPCQENDKTCAENGIPQICDANGAWIDAQPCDTGYECKGGSCSFVVKPENTEETCADGLDNDQDGKFDCDDEECKDFEACKEDIDEKIPENTEETCSDKTDNDQNGKMDCEEESCMQFDFCKQTPDPVCSDGKREGDELCDGDDVNAMTCAKLDKDKYAAGNVTCTNQCTFDTAGCVKCTKTDTHLCGENQECSDEGKCVDKNMACKTKEDIGKVDNCECIEDTDCKDGKNMCELNICKVRPVAECNESKKCAQGKYCKENPANADLNQCEDLTGCKANGCAAVGGKQGKCDGVSWNSPGVFTECALGCNAGACVEKVCDANTCSDANARCVVSAAKPQGEYVACGAGTVCDKGSCKAMPKIVISQAYTGGAITNATFRSKYIELFNQGTTAATLNHWSIQYASASGDKVATICALPETVTIPAKKYYLIELKKDDAKGKADLAPAPDFTCKTGVNAAAGNGKLFVVPGTAAVAAPSAPAAGSYADALGYGSANWGEGGKAMVTLTNTTAGWRKNDGCIDTDDNATDFEKKAPAPRNAKSPAKDCSAVPTETIACGNGPLGTNQVCDNKVQAADTCAKLMDGTACDGTWTGSVSCNADCEFDTSKCECKKTAPETIACGNGPLGTNQVCDGIVPSDATCAKLMSTTCSGTWLGEVTCNPACQWDTKACQCIPKCKTGETPLPGKPEICAINLGTNADVRALRDKWNADPNDASLKSSTGHQAWIMTKNIHLAADTAWVGIGTKKNPFTGIFNGGGFKISSDALNSPDGIFGELRNANIDNLTLEPTFVEHSSYYYTGGCLFGKAANGSVKNITIKCQRKYIILNSSQFGILGGYAKGVQIDNIKADVSLEFKDASIGSGAKVGGLIGHAEDTQISNITAKGSILIDYKGDCSNGDGAIFSDNLMRAGGVLGAAYSSTIRKVIANIDIYVDYGLDYDIYDRDKTCDALTGGIAGSMEKNTNIDTAQHTGIIRTKIGEIRSSNGHRRMYMRTGGIAGYSSDSDVYNTTSKSNITIGTYSNHSGFKGYRHIYFGGLTGQASNSKFTNCAFTGTVTKDNSDYFYLYSAPSGAIGRIDEFSTIHNSYTLDMNDSSYKYYESTSEQNVTMTSGVPHVGTKKLLDVLNKAIADKLYTLPTGDYLPWVEETIGTNKMPVIDMDATPVHIEN